MRILLTGATGAIGSRLAPRLVAEGHEVRGLSRDPGAAMPHGVERFAGDAVTGAGLDRALHGVDVAYFLIHSMEQGAGDRFPALEHAAADNFGLAARVAGVRRIVYLGGLIPADAEASLHLSSRLAVERALLGATPEAVAFRASIVIGAASRSFRFLVRLIERMPVLVLPAWRTHVTTPIDERDVTEYLLRAATIPPAARLSIDIGGPERVTYQGLIERIRDLMLLSRPVLAIPQLTATPIASRVSAAIAGEQHELIGPLMEGLDSDLLPRDESAPGTFGLTRHSLDAAIEHALAEWESSEPLRAR